MVTHIAHKKWECPYCGEKYTDEEDAEDCAEECSKLNIDSPIERDGLDEFLCEYCFKVYKDFFYANKCEQKHINGKDLHYENKCYRDSIERLQKAANLSGQTKLEAY